MKALDIVIGLVFIYFLYSLLVSIIGEMVSTWIGMRARLLRQGIVNLLNDNSVIFVPMIAFSKKAFRNSFLGFGKFLYFKMKKYFQDIFMIENKDFIYSSAGRFYKEQNIKSLAKTGSNKWFSIRNTKPSYISKAKFTETLINMLQRKGQGVNTWDRIVFAIEKNTLNLEPATHQKLSGLLTSANGNYSLFIKKLEESFDEMMDRVNGWYKRKLGFILFWLGMILCIFLNVDTFQIIQSLSKDNDKRENIVKLAQYAVQDSSRISALLSTGEDSIRNFKMLKESYQIAYNDIRQSEKIMSTGWDFKNTTKIFSFNKQDSFKLRKIEPSCIELSNKIKSLTDSFKTNEYTVKTLKNILDSITIFEDSLRMLTYSIDTMLRNERNILKNAFIPRMVTIDTIDFENKLISGTASSGFGSKIAQITRRLSPFEQKFWGLSLTALALSLGANFWFDLLKKLVSLRGSGVKPEEKTKEKESQNTIVTDDIKIKNDILNPVDIIISKYRNYWESLPGVIAVNKSIKELIDGKKKECIELIVDKDFEHDYKEDLVNSEGISLEIVPGKIISYNQGLCMEDAPENALRHSHTGVWGTPSGIVVNRKTGRYAILSCGHILKSDNSGFIKENKNSVNLCVTPDSNLEGTVVNIAMTNFLDCGIVELKDFRMTDIKFPGPIDKLREVTREDRAKNTKVNIHTLNGLVQGKICDSDKNFMFSDGLNEFRMYNLIMIGHEDSAITDTLTKHGDSGALITDDKKIPIAILIGAGVYNGKEFSFGIKISEIFDALYLKPVES